MPTFAIRTVKIADVAQLAEHLICNQAAVGSSPSIGSGSKGRRTEQQRTIDLGSYQSGQMGQTVNLLAYAFGGSNPSLPTIKKECRLELQNPGRQTEAPLRGGAGRASPREACRRGDFRGKPPLCRRRGAVRTLMRSVFAEVAQLIEHQPSKLRVASLSLVFRSTPGPAVEIRWRPPAENRRGRNKPMLPAENDGGWPLKRTGQEQGNACSRKQRGRLR